ncbi:MAG: type II secretion system protein [Thioalkalispiraceae bacterium]|jgi:MSHA biogenesis protein MshO
MASPAKQNGFTLIELVITIVVLAAIMAGTAAYITNSTVAYTNVAQRDQLTSLGRVTIERVTRELRQALPNSIRIQNNCIEFFPVKAGSVYFDLPVSSAGNSFTAMSFTIPASANIEHVVVYPYNATALYSQSNPGPLAGFASAAGSPTTTVTLTANHRFALHAPHRRFYLVEDPVSYCIVGTNLNRYENYGINASQATPPSGTAQLLAENIQSSDGGAVTPFTYVPGSLQRNGLVTLDFRFLTDGEWIRLSHEVQIRNVL